MSTVNQAKDYYDSAKAADEQAYYNSVYEAEKIGLLLKEQGLNHSSVGRAAMSAAYNAALDSVSRMPRDQLEVDLISYQTHTDEKAKLQEARNILIDVSVSTNEIDARLMSLEENVDKDAARVVGLLLLKSLQPVMFSDGRPIDIRTAREITNEAPLANVEVSDETAEQELRSMSIKLLHVDDKPYIGIGERRRIPLSGAREFQRNYAPERFAAVVVLSELLHGEEIRVTDLWTRMYTQILGEDVPPAFDRQAMFQVRNFLESLHYRRQPIFMHNKIRGLGSAYGINPDFNYNIELDVESYDNIRDFAVELEHMPVNQEPTVIESASTQSLASESAVQTAEILQSEVMPSILELHAFLIKVSSAMSVISKQVDASEYPALTIFYEQAEEILEFLDQNSSSEQRLENTKESLELIRTKVADKFIRITEDDKLLNTLLEEQSNGILTSSYGEEVAHGTLGLIEAVLDMDKTEKEFLKKIIVADEVTEIKLRDGSFSGGMNIEGGRHIVIVDGKKFDGSTEAPHQPSTYDYDDDEEITYIDLRTDFPKVDTTAENYPDADTSDETTQDTLELDIQSATETVTILPPKAQVEKTNTRHADKRHLHSLVEDKIRYVTDTVGKKSDIFISTRQLEAIFGIGVSSVVNASENNLISETVKNGLNLEEIVTLLMVNDSDPELRRILNAPRNMKHMRKTIRTAVRTYASKTTK